MSASASSHDPASPELTTAAPLYLKRGKERRLRFGHPWIFSNEIDIARSPLKGMSPGEPVDVRTAQGRTVAGGYVNPRTLISVRIVSRRPGVYLDRTLLGERLRRAQSLREVHFDRPFYRLVYGESDGLPGLIVDRYDDVVVAQTSTAGMDRLRESVVDAIVELLHPRAVLLKNDTGARELEGLERGIEEAHGTLPESVPYEEHGARFEITPRSGQKTGWFLDHRANRRAVLPHVAGKRVLDLFCYTGAWGIQAAVAGAREVLCVDSSASALAQAEHHAGLNGVADRVRCVRADAFDHLRELRASGEVFDVVVADPPAFIRRKKDAVNGFEAYRRLNGLAMQVLTDEGLLVSASCSFHLARDKLVEIIARVSSGIGRRALIVAEGHQDADHPVHPALLESSYLKALFVRVGHDA